MPRSRSFSPVPALLCSATLLGGCAAPSIPPGQLDTQTAAERYAARSLEAPDLRRYLRENLGHEPTAWDFDALCWVGFYYQPTLEMARAQWAVAQAGERVATTRPNPTLTLAPGYNFTREPGVSPWMPTIAADLPLSTHHKGDKLARIAALQAAAARHAIAVAAWQLRSDLRKALIEAHAAADRAEALRHDGDMQQRVVTLLEARLAAGSIAATEVSVARTELIRAESAAAEAANQAASSRAKVATILGLPVAALASLTLPVPPTPTPLDDAQRAAARAYALHHRADLLQALSQYEAAQIAIELEVAKRFPDIHLGPSYQWDQGQNKWTLGLTIELPVFNRNEAGIAEAIAKRAQAAAQVNVVQNQVVGAIDAAEAALQSAARQLSRATELRAQVERHGQMVRERQRLGAADQFDVDFAQRELSTAEIARVDAENAFAAAAGQLEDALQVPLSHLEAIENPAARP